MCSGLRAWSQKNCGALHLLLLPTVQLCSFWCCCCCCHTPRSIVEAMSCLGPRVPLPIVSCGGGDLTVSEQLRWSCGSYPFTRSPCGMSRCMSSPPGVHAGAIPSGCCASKCSKWTEAVEQLLLPVCCDAASKRSALFWMVLFWFWFTEWEMSGSLEVLEIKIPESKLLNA